jgi:hypothetical protein
MPPALCTLLQAQPQESGGLIFPFFNLLLLFFFSVLFFINIDLCQISGQNKAKVDGLFLSKRSLYE